MNIEISPKKYEKILHWYDAVKHCQSLTIDNKNDWRLPSIEELKEIYNSENDFEDDFYWSSSTEYPSIGAKRLDMENGIEYCDTKAFRYYVRPVRTI